VIDDVEAFLALFDERPPREVHDFLAALLLETGFDPTELSPAAEQMLADFARRAGIIPGATAEATTSALRSYFTEHPLDPALIRAFKRTLRQELLAKDPGLLARSASRWLAADPKRLSSPDAPVPEGVAGRGQLGFFAAHKKLRSE
jgi:hypothetical protein